MGMRISLDLLGFIDARITRREDGVECVEIPIPFNAVRLPKGNGDKRELVLSRIYLGTPHKRGAKYTYEGRMSVPNEYKDMILESDTIFPKQRMCWAYMYEGEKRTSDISTAEDFERALED